MKDLGFHREGSALLIIDMQNAFISKEGSLSRMGLDTSRTAIVIEPIKALRQAFHEQRRPVIFIQHTHTPDGSDMGVIASVFPPIAALGHCFDGTWDAEFIEELRPDAQDMILRKHRFSAFFQTGLDELLKEYSIDSLVVAGIATNICVESTIRDAFYRDYNVFVPREATASFTEEQEMGSIGNFHFAFARVKPLEEILEAMGKS